MVETEAEGVELFKVSLKQCRWVEFRERLGRVIPPLYRASVTAAKRIKVTIQTIIKAWPNKRLERTKVKPGDKIPA